MLGFDLLAYFPISDIYEVTGDGSGCGHLRGDEMSSSAASLSSFEIPVAG